ncbi:MAG: NADP-dependent glyceraldehyde-3-phosphate dehydrogenase, partial [archaeon]
IDALANLVARSNLNSACQRGPDTFPFGGRKDSAKGVLSVKDALKAFSTETVVAAKDTSENRALIKAIWDKKTSNVLNTGWIL